MATIYTILSLVISLLSIIYVESILITNLSGPAAAALDSAGRIWIIELHGIIKMASSVNSDSVEIMKDMSPNVAAYGDVGMTGLAIKDNYLYVGYQKNNATFGPNMETCNDNGVVNGRSPDSVYGCITHGVVSRFPIAGNGSLGLEEVIFDEANVTCTQFNTGGIGDIAFNANGDLLVSFGSGADDKEDAIPDYGQYGGNPCGTGNIWGGQLRSQDPNTFNGKIVLLDAANNWSPSIYASGFFHPFRMSFTSNTANQQLYVADAGMLNIDEINGPVNKNDNFGFPCTQGNVPIAVFNAPSMDPAPPVCTNMTQFGGYKAPYWYYNHSDAAVISAIGYNPNNNRMYYGDYVNGVVVSMSRDLNQDQPTSWKSRVLARYTYPSQLTYFVANENTPNFKSQMVLVDVGIGQVVSEDQWTGGDPPESGAATVTLSLSVLISFVALLLLVN